MASVIQREVTPAIYTFSKPFARFGLIPIGGRSTAVKLRDDKSLWLLASTPLDEPTRTKLDQFGVVKYIVAPDNVHSLYLKQYADAYPQAKVIGVLGLEEKNKDVKFAGLYGVDPEGTQYGFEEEISARFFSTFPNRDVAFFHKDSKTMINADLLFNLPCNEQYADKVSLLGRWFPLRPFSSLHQSFLKMTGGGIEIPDTYARVLDSSKPLSQKGGSAAERKALFARDAEAVAKWDFERIIPCHGDVLELNPSEPGKSPKQAWLSAYSAFLNPDGTSKF